MQRALELCRETVLLQSWPKGL